jgi:hypothetical protein
MKSKTKKKPRKLLKPRSKPRPKPKSKPKKKIVKRKLTKTRTVRGRASGTKMYRPTMYRIRDFHFRPGRPLGSAAGFVDALKGYYNEAKEAIGKTYDKAKAGISKFYNENEEAIDLAAKVVLGALGVSGLGYGAYQLLKTPAVIEAIGKLKDAIGPVTAIAGAVKGTLGGIFEPSAPSSLPPPPTGARYSEDYDYGEDEPSSIPDPATRAALSAMALQQAQMAGPRQQVVQNVGPMASRQEVLEGMRVHDKAMPPRSEIVQGVVLRPGDLYDPQMAENMQQEQIAKAHVLEIDRLPGTEGARYTIARLHPDFQMPSQSDPEYYQKLLKEYARIFQIMDKPRYTGSFAARSAQAAAMGNPSQYLAVHEQLRQQQQAERARLQNEVLEATPLGGASGLRSKQFLILGRRPREDDEYVLRIVNARGGQRSIEPTPEQRRVAHLRYIEEYDSDAERRLAAGRTADMIEDLSAML